MNNDSKIEQFIQITNSSKDVADQYLKRFNYDIKDAIFEFFQHKNEDQNKSKEKKLKSNKTFTTFKDINTEKDQDDQMNFFTGGEKSALEVQGADKNKKKSSSYSLIDQIFQKAKAMTFDKKLLDEGKDSESNNLMGKGYRLNSENLETKQEVVNNPKKKNCTKKVITFWKQGFTIGDNGFYKYDDPNNKFILEELNQGRIPMSLLDLEYGEDVDVIVYKKTDEYYVPPPSKKDIFQSTGIRLGSPVPGEIINTEVKTDVQVMNNKISTNSENVGDVKIQVRFATGKVVTQFFNSADPTSAVYDFVKNHSYNSEDKIFTLNHAFPIKIIECSDSISINAMNLDNTVVVQKWI